MKAAPTKELALRQMSTLFEQDEALSNTLAAALLIHSLKSRQVYPLLGLEPPAMVELQILASFRAASWHGVAKSVVQDRLTQQEQQEEGYFTCPLKIHGLLPMIHIPVFSQQHGQGKEVKLLRKRLRQ